MAGRRRRLSPLSCALSFLHRTHTHGVWPHMCVVFSVLSLFGSHLRFAATRRWACVVLEERSCAR